MRLALVRWGYATIVFVIIGLIDVRFGHAVGLAALLAALSVVFVWDTRARSRSAGPSTPESGRDDP